MVMKDLLKAGFVLHSPSTSRVRSSRAGGAQPIEIDDGERILPLDPVHIYNVGMTIYISRRR